MKKSMLVLCSLLLVITLFSSCELSLYRQKKLIVQNDSEVTISGITLMFLDDSPIIARDIELTPLISPSESKEYALPYIKNGGRSHQWRIMLQAYDEDTELPVADEYVLFTFNSTSKEEIIFTFDEGDIDGEYTFEGNGSGFQRIADIT